MILACLQKRHGCFVVHRYFARAVMGFVACCCAHQQLNQCTTRALCEAVLAKTRARAFGFYVENSACPPDARRGSAEDWMARLAQSPLASCGVSCVADRRRPCHSSATTGHESARRRRRAPVDAPRPVSERKPRSRVSRVSALGADHENRQRGTNVGVEEAHLRPLGGRRWQPPHVNTAGVAFRSGQGHSMGVLARVTLVTAVGGCVTD